MPDITATRPSSGAPIESGWGQQIHDGFEGIQAGSVNVTLSAANSAVVAVTYPRAYTAVPLVQVTAVAGSATLYAIADSVSATGLGVRLSRKDEANTTVTVTVHWLAIGTPA